MNLVTMLALLSVFPVDKVLTRTKSVSLSHRSFGYRTLLLQLIDEITLSSPRHPQEENDALPLAVHDELFCTLWRSAGQGMSEEESLFWGEFYEINLLLKDRWDF